MLPRQRHSEATEEAGFIADDDFHPRRLHMGRPELRSSFPETTGSGGARPGVALLRSVGQTRNLGLERPANRGDGHEVGVRKLVGPS